MGGSYGSRLAGSQQQRSFSSGRGTKRSRPKQRARDGGNSKSRARNMSKRPGKAQRATQGSELGLGGALA
ncbi:unnamed protein product, partial [Chrysoparadoxa australica]